MKPKSYHFLLVILSALFLISCQKEYGYYGSSRLRVVVDLTDAVEDFESEEEEPIFALDKKNNVRVQYFLYDADGNLCADGADYVKDYYRSTTFNFDNVPLGDYILIAATDVVERTGGSAYAPLYWTFNGVDRLSTFAVVANDRMDYMGERLLTLTEARVTINGRRKTQRLSIDALPVTAMVCTTFFDIFHWDKNVMPGERANRIYNYFELNYRHYYDVVTYNPSRSTFPWVISESPSDVNVFAIDNLSPDDFDDKSTKNVFGYHAVLPGSYNFTGYGEYAFSGDSRVYSHQTRTSGVAHFEAGGMYYVDFDIEEWSVSLEGTAYSRSASGKTRQEPFVKNPTNEIYRSNVSSHAVQ